MEIICYQNLVTWMKNIEAIKEEISRIDLRYVVQEPYNLVGNSLIFVGKTGTKIVDCAKEMQKYCIKNRCKALLGCNLDQFFFNEYGSMLGLGNVPYVDGKLDVLHFKYLLDPVKGFNGGDDAKQLLLGDVRHSLEPFGKLLNFLQFNIGVYRDPRVRNEVEELFLNCKKSLAHIKSENYPN